MNRDLINLLKSVYKNANDRNHHMLKLDKIVATFNQNKLNVEILSQPRSPVKMMCGLRGGAGQRGRGKEKEGQKKERKARKRQEELERGGWGGGWGGYVH